jgi:hypothetical protein
MSFRVGVAAYGKGNATHAGGLEESSSVHSLRLVYAACSGNCVGSLSLADLSKDKKKIHGNDSSEQRGEVFSTKVKKQRERQLGKK